MLRPLASSRQKKAPCRRINYAVWWRLAPHLQVLLQCFLLQLRALSHLLNSAAPGVHMREREYGVGEWKGGG